MSVTSAPPTTSVAQATAGTATGPAQLVVVQVLGSYGGDSVRNGLVQTLQEAAGTGSVITGTVTDVRADGTFSLQTKAGPELLLHHPPELPLTVGANVALRIVSVAPTPQVAILTVDGKLVSSQLTGPVNPPQTSPPQTSPLQAGAPTPTAAPPASGPILPPATLASTLFAALSFEDEVAIEQALSGNAGANSGGVSGGLAPLSTQAVGTPITADAESVIATLVRPAPARPGSAPIAAGTRYLATIAIGETDTPTAPPAVRTQPSVASSLFDSPTDPPTAEPSGDENTPLPSQPAAPQTTPAQAPRPLDLTDFTALTTTLAGRVLASSTASETLVDTALGTLLIPVQDTPPPTGAAAQLKITAVAPPVTTDKPESAKAPAIEAAEPQPVLQAAAEALATLAPALAQQVQAQLSLPPSDQLTALILNFLGGLKTPAPAPRWPEPTIRKALVDAGRTDLATKLDLEASRIGQVQPAPPGEWSVTVLPFLGSATSKPMRLYRRTPDAEERERGGGDRFVIELQLVRLGALQFDGLVRERRFDLVLRSERPLDDGLKALAERTFRDSLLISGWSGELSYARTGPVPLVSLKPEGGGVGLSA
ncbi:hypothetical protein GCM10011611_51860 [Aliidongia dinghuensis]|uniref:Flagellar hook-length control protein FliK n=1 Tax=Aliidongia dinghuensis TaxID=1867774 RepID=A0A8J3E5W1_9PROT|nr:hypothetical protein [Aliidongia dinghuensis]GGF39128.1 hypothetical protein GCM10011611_51860 [Aliidongia dinghuensis]